MVKMFMLAVALFLSGCVAVDASILDVQPLEDESAIIIECAIADDDGYCSCPPCEPPPKATVNEPDSRNDCATPNATDPETGEICGCGCPPPPPSVNDPEFTPEPHPWLVPPGDVNEPDARPIDCCEGCPGPDKPGQPQCCIC